MTTTPLRVPLAYEAAAHLHGWTRSDLGPSERVAHLGALHGYLIAVRAMPRDALNDAHSSSLGDDAHPSEAAERWALRETAVPVEELQPHDLAVELPYLSGVLYGYRQGTSERPDADTCDGCTRRITDDDEDRSSCRTTGGTYCDSTEHQRYCGNPADCFEED